MKFSDYCASFITPQMTLLEKFNALIKYLEKEKVGEKLTLYKHNLVIQDNGVNYNFQIFSNYGKEINTASLFNELMQNYIAGYFIDYEFDFIKSVIYGYLPDSNILYFQRYQNPNVLYISVNSVLDNVEIVEVL